MGKQQVNEFNIDGKVLHVGMPVYFTEKMTKRICVLEVFADKKFRQEVAFDFVNDNMGLLNNIQEGDWVNISFQLRAIRRSNRMGRPGGLMAWKVCPV